MASHYSSTEWMNGFSVTQPDLTIYLTTLPVSKYLRFLDCSSRNQHDQTTPSWYSFIRLESRESTQVWDLKEHLLKTSIYRNSQTLLLSKNIFIHKSNACLSDKRFVLKMLELGINWGVIGLIASNILFNMEEAFTYYSNIFLGVKMIGHFYKHL